jgi:hypothetical protein
MVISLPLVSCRDGVCVGFVPNQHNHDNFEKHTSWHASIPLHLVHHDLCGPLCSPSFFGCKYFLTFIDEFSICTWVYFLKLKREVFEIFLAYKALVDKKYGHQLQMLRIYNGGDNVKNNVKNYFIAHVIQMQPIVPCTP